MSSLGVKIETELNYYSTVIFQTDEAEEIKIKNRGRTCDFQITRNDCKRTKISSSTSMSTDNAKLKYQEI